MTRSPDKDKKMGPEHEADERPSWGFLLSDARISQSWSFRCRRERERCLEGKQERGETEAGSGKSQEGPTMRLFVRPGHHTPAPFPSLASLSCFAFVCHIPPSLSSSLPVTALQSHEHTTATLWWVFLGHRKRLRGPQLPLLPSVCACVCVCVCAKTLYSAREQTCACALFCGCVLQGFASYK